MNYLEEIKNFLPSCEQEESDQRLMLSYCEQYKDEVLFRTCEAAHLTASSMIFNPDRTKVLMAYHNIYDSWAWTGGHADGEADGLYTAIKEAKEETGIRNIRVLSEHAAALDILAVQPHWKKGKFVSAHVHLNLAYLLEAEEEEGLTVCEGENSQVGWLPIDHLQQYISEAHMMPVYEKLIKQGQER